MSVTNSKQPTTYPNFLVVLELLKPITWFPPMWAYACGVISSGASIAENLDLLILGIIVAGPVVCGMSQAANDWCDRHVDTINEPNRPIPSGRMPGNWGLKIALGMTLLALVLGWQLGIWGFISTIFAALAAWVYSIEPIRLKKSGIWGPGLVGLCYEGIPWFTGAAVMLQAFPDTKIILVAIAYAIGAHGIMTLNDFKALKGDKALGINSLPVQLGPERAAKIACYVMAAPQIFVVALLYSWGLPLFSAFVLLLVFGQFIAMRRLLSDPERYAPWYNSTGVLMFVSGMMVCSIGISQAVGQ
ncbi:MAG: chlorophyll synthase ChlG [Rhodobacterales bacterium]|nr:chlorophyll synthase ChlG [Rhodobacterales bacterium]